MKRKRIIWLSIVAVLVGIAAAAYSYSGPHRTVTTTYTTDERRVCYWEAQHPDLPMPRCFLKLYYSPDSSCPSLNPSTNQGYFSASSCMPAWHGLSCPASGGRLCAIGWQDTWTENCSPGQPGCTSIQHTTTTTYPPATVTGSTSCSSPGNNGWCIGQASLNLSGSEPLAGYNITGIESSLGMLCNSSSCTWSFPEGSTSLTFWALSSYGDTSLQASASMKVDMTPPTLSITPSGGTLGDNGWFTYGPVIASASATDPTSGVAGVSINGGSNTFAASSDGVYPLVASAPDNAGNTATTSATIKLDTVPPSLGASASPVDGVGGWYVSPAIVNATASDATSGLAGVQVRVDGGDWQDGSTVTVDTDGTHSAEFQAWDQAGNHSSTSPLMVQVDSTPPVADASLPAPDGLNGWYVSPVTITANSSDVVSGLASQGISLDGSSWAPSVTISTDGTYTVQVHAQDNAGNSANSSKTVQVDATVPSASLEMPPANGNNSWYISPVTVSASGSDATSGVASQLVSLDGSAWSSSLTLPTDGIYTVQARVIDNAGNATTVSQTVQIDQTQPSVSAPTLTGTSGQEGWFTSSVEFATSASDVTSGVASLLYSVDGRTLEPGPLVLTDGRHIVQVQSTDRAGNVSIESQAVDVDSTPPQSGFVSPAEGSVAFAHGSEFVMSGLSSDATSGLEEAQISLDGGSTWQPLAINPDGSWSYTWDTTTVANGPHEVLVSAGDQAGNLEHTARITVIVANLGPSVSITESFWIYQQAEVGFSAGFLPITSARIVVSDAGEHSRTYSYSASSLPSSFQWDGVWNDGSKAGPGSYQVEVSAWDMFGNDAHAVGTIQIPYPRPTPTVISSPQGTPTQTPTPTATPTMPPPATPTRPPATPLPPAPVQEEAPKPQTPIQRPPRLWPLAGFVALLAALATASLSDPRPRALDALGKALEDLNLQGEQPQS